MSEMSNLINAENPRPGLEIATPGCRQSYPLCIKRFTEKLNSGCTLWGTLSAHTKGLKYSARNSRITALDKYCDLRECGLY